MLPSSGGILTAKTQFNRLYTVTGVKNSSLYFPMVVFTGGVACCAGNVVKNIVENI